MSDELTTANRETMKLAKRSFDLSSVMNAAQKSMNRFKKDNRINHYYRANQNFYKAKIEWLKVNISFIKIHIGRLDKIGFLSDEQKEVRRARAKETIAKFTEELLDLEYQLDQIVAISKSKGGRGRVDSNN